MFLNCLPVSAVSEYSKSPILTKIKFRRKARVLRSFLRGSRLSIAERPASSHVKLT
ncbi:hypothetical protein RSSM_02669 [Rhodopirellula sallentina SM41]|uniref:Uncharacterized protein n=1 Tax=Rhodopirellula sallentina SM41 TaxID=1263870 RepID=M5U360_9BACT|nr:hypothetical protein RSSM_02669 [Rhodopirellula sallentina SM41]